jgi:hypothetical protein
MRIEGVVPVGLRDTGWVASATTATVQAALVFPVDQGRTRHEMKLGDENRRGLCAVK